MEHRMVHSKKINNSNNICNETKDTNHCKFCLENYLNVYVKILSN